MTHPTTDRDRMIGEGEWIEWSGGSVPVPSGTVVEVKTCDDSIYVGECWSDPFDAHCNGFWQHTRPPEDHIKAYRVVSK